MGTVSRYQQLEQNSLVKLYIEMTDNVSFKVVLKDEANAETELRRFVVDKDVSSSFPYLQEKLCLVFPQLKQKIFSITWSDEDGDMVTIANDEELIIALTEMRGPVYKLCVNAKSMKKPENTGNDSTEESHIHAGVTCDVCEKTPIIGSRYKCVVCPDFDLCGSCEAAGRHPCHNMMRISNPEMAFPQRLFKRIHKMQERAEKRNSRQENRPSTSKNTGAVPPPTFSCPRGRHGMFRGQGMHGFEGMRHGFEGMRHGFEGMGGMGGMRGRGGMRGGFGGMGGMRGGCGANGWAGPAFEAMMKGWMGEPQTQDQEKKTNTKETTKDASEHQKADATASEAKQCGEKENPNGEKEGASTPEQEAMNAAFEQFAAMTG